MRRIFFVLFAVISFSASAQNTAPVLKFGFLSYDAVLQSMPDYAVVEANMEKLRHQYAAEQKRVEDEFNKKYEEFLDGQRDFPQTILQKRQNELQELLDKNIAFKKESQRLLEQAQKEAMVPLKTRLADALARVGSSRGLAFILNTDQNAVPWMNITMGEDVTDAVKAALR
jgi:outer membrane protein